MPLSFILFVLFIGGVSAVYVPVSKKVHFPGIN